MDQRSNFQDGDLAPSGRFYVKCTPMRPGAERPGSTPIFCVSAENRYVSAQNRYDYPVSGLELNRK